MGGFTRAAGVALALFLAGAPAAWAQEARSVRLIGQAPGAEDPVPRTFVLDLTLTKGDGAFQQQVGGWFAALPPTTGSGEATGACVRDQCAIDVSLTDAKLSLTGDFGGAAASGRFAVTNDDGKVTAQGEVSLAPLTGPVPGVGALAAPDAVSGAELKDLLQWSDAAVDTGAAAPDTPDDVERDALAGWQNAQGLPMTGLILAADLRALRAHAEAARAAAGWTRIGGEAEGWSAGYPAALLPKASQAGREHRFASADGQAVLVVAVDPPVDDDAFAALTDKLTADRPGRSDNNYTRVNADLIQSYVEAGKAVTAVYHSRPGGLARLVFSRPAGQTDKWEMFDALLSSSFAVSDTVKAP